MLRGVCVRTGPLGLTQCVQGKTHQVTGLMEPRSVLASLENLVEARKAFSSPKPRLERVKKELTYAAGEKLSLYSGAPTLRSTTVAVTFLPL